MSRCSEINLLKPFNDDSFPTLTSKLQSTQNNSRFSPKQANLEKLVKNSFQESFNKNKNLPKLNRLWHNDFLNKGLLSLPQHYSCLDCSRTWLVYWIVHSLFLLENKKSIACFKKRLILFLNQCQNSQGGYGGAPFQISHLATCYGAVNTLVSLCDEEALKSINREQLYNFLIQMKQKDGSFTIHLDGEIDVRSAYCAASIAYICGIETDELFENTSEWLLKCQNYEGGFGATPGNEAHGGYTFCAVAALMLLGQAHRINIKNLLRWITMKQQSFEGGFVGRTNKLVDGCYSFWQGACLVLVNSILVKEKSTLVETDKWLFDQQALQEYLLCCCQDRMGGLIDKPERKRDFYHTCYGLSGLSVAQFAFTSETIVGPDENKLIPIHPVYNIHIKGVEFAKNFFENYKIKENHKKK